MRRSVVAAAIAVGLLLVALIGGREAAARTACTPGLIKIQGVASRVFCGPAKATVYYGTKTFKLAGGECEKGSQYLSVNIGTVVLGIVKTKPNALGLLVGRSPVTDGKPAARDGTYVGGVLSLSYGTKAYLVRGDTLKITLQGNRSRGTFSGESILVSPTVKVTGSFSC